MTQLNPGRPPVGGAARKLHATRLGLMVLLPVYAIVTAWAMVLVIFIVPFDGIRHLEVLAEWQGNADHRVSFTFTGLALVGAGLVVSLASIIAMPFAVAFWLGMLSSLRAVSWHELPNAARMQKALKWMMALLPFTILLTALMGLFVIGEFSVGWGVLYGMAALFCILLCLLSLWGMSRPPELRVNRSAYPLTTPASLPRTLAKVFGVFVVSALLLPGSCSLSPDYIFRLEYIYAPLLVLIVAISIGWWRAPLSLWRHGGWAILAAAAFIAAAIGAVAFMAYAMMDFNVVERILELRSADGLAMLLSPFVLVPLTLLPFLLPLIPLLLWLSTTHARLRRERDAAREG